MSSNFAPPASMNHASAIERLLKRDRLVVMVALFIVCLLAWGYMLAGAGMSMTARMDWTATYAMLVFAMWWLMMVAMMLPSAAPAVLLFSNVSRKQKALRKPYVPAAFFLIGYLLIWAFFSLVATGAQWVLELDDQLSMMAGTENPALGAAILIAASVWQLTPLKQACLRHCRGPLQFLTRGFRPGVTGALHMGVEHGLYCLGCCWFLMALLFYGGVMNLYWIAGLAIYVLIEKVLPAGLVVGRLAGVALLTWGCSLLILEVF